jgi:hypothetical protein
LYSSRYRRTNHQASAHNSGNTTKIRRNVVSTDRLSSGQRPTIDLNDENQNPNPGAPGRKFKMTKSRNSDLRFPDFEF